MGSAPVRKDLYALGAAFLLAALAALALALAAPAGAADPEELEAKLSSAREEAASLAAELRSGSERLAASEAEAAAAAAREDRLSGLLAEGEARSAELRREAAAAADRLESERARLRRARRALAARLVAIYESGQPSTTELVLAAADLEALAAGVDYLDAVAESDSALAARVEQVRDEVRAEAARAEERHTAAVAYSERLLAARDEIAGVRAAAQSAAAGQRSLAASRKATLTALRGEIDGWVGEIETARAASRSEAESEVDRWLGGPYSIPTYIVMCESGGNYSAVNPSSGAGGAYQILPSTWELYGGKGEPQQAPKAEQDRIAAEIWADSGGSAWVCS
ncbi:MAG: transglycosylase family protein [Solirubrobacterales bacterium]